MADNPLKVEIVTPKSVLYKGSAESVTVPGSKGSFQVLKNHAAIVSALEPGIVKIEGPDGKKTFATGEGFTEVSDNKVSILVERAFDSSDLDKTSLEDEIAELRRKLKDAGKQEMEEIRLQIKELDIRLKAVIRTES